MRNNLDSKFHAGEIRIAYRYEDFEKTALYENLKKWETAHSDFVLFKLVD